MNKKLVFAFLLSASLLILLEWRGGTFFMSEAKTQILSQLKKSLNNFQVDSPKAQNESDQKADSKLLNNNNNNNNIDWKERVHLSTLKMSSLTENPERIDQEITELAISLNEKELESLTVNIKSKNSSGDQKLLAAELISRSQLPKSISLLEDLIKTDSNSISQNPAIQQEFQALQMLAIEGFLQKPELKTQAQRALNELIQSTDNNRLQDRLHRSLWALSGKAPSPEQQDLKALEEVLKHN